MTVILLALALMGNGPLVLVDPPEWNFGAVEAGAAALERELVLRSRAEQPASVSLASTCDCLSVEPASRELPAGGVATFRLRYDPRDDRGAVEKYLILRTSLPELPKALYLVRGFVAPPGGAAGREAPARAGEAPAAGAWPMDFYYAPGCRSCLRFLRRTLPALERRLGLSLEVREHNILEPQVFEDYQRILSARGEHERAYPALLVGGAVLQGEKDIRSGLEGALRRLQVKEGAPPTGAGGRRALRAELAALPVLAAGLLDGVNPCAFTTLVFLLSALAVAGRSRREILSVGLCFSLAVFATYLGIGLGLFQAVRLAAGFPLVAAVLRWVLVAALVVLAGLSIYDYVLVRSGRGKDMLLQLPRAFKERIHRDIRSRVRSSALAASSLVLGFLVAVFELACTGQVYLPTLVYLYRVRPHAGGFAYLLLYNLGFILPLLAVFALAYWGVASRLLSAWVRRSLGAVKIALAVLFVGLAILTVFT
jgi:cytochrome c biogenesis protein CcdA